MKAIPIIKTILKITVVLAAIVIVGLLVKRLPHNCSWVLVLLLFYKLFTTALKIIGTIIKSVASLCLSALKICFLIYIITLII